MVTDFNSFKIECRIKNKNKNDFYQFNGENN